MASACRSVAGTLGLRWFGARHSHRHYRVLMNMADELPLLASLDALVRSLQHEWTASDPPTLLEARALLAAVVSARRLVVADRSAVRRSLREPCCDDDLPF